MSLFDDLLADKIIAFAFRENRLKNRDLWDIAWLVQQGVGLPAHLIPLKVRDHQRSDAEFIGLVESRLAELEAKPEMKQDFLREMQRFLPAATVQTPSKIRAIGLISSRFSGIRLLWRSTP